MIKYHRIRDLREDNDLSQTTVAVRSKCWRLKPPTYTQYMNNYSHISVPICFKKQY